MSSSTLAHDYACGGGEGEGEALERERERELEGRKDRWGEGITKKEQMEASERGWVMMHAGCYCACWLLCCAVRECRRCPCCAVRT